MSDTEEEHQLHSFQLILNERTNEENNEAVIPVIDHCYEYLEKYSEDEALERLRLLFDSKEFQREQLQLDKLLRAAVGKGYPDVCEFLLKKGAHIIPSVSEVDRSPKKTKFWRPSTVISLLWKPQTEDPLICVAARALGKNRGQKSKYFKCCEILLRHEPSIINNVDRYGNSGLFYASRYEYHDLMKKFLDSGAYLGVIDNNNVMAIEQIDPKFLYSYLDRCVTRVCNNDGDPTVRLNYSNLTQPTPMSGSCARYASQIDLIKFLSTDRKYKRLILHPLIKYFIWVEWRNVRFLPIWNSSLIIFLLATMIYVTLFINDSDYGPKYTMIGLKIMSHITLSLIIFREMFKFWATEGWKWRYFTNVRHLLQILLIVLLSTVLFSSNEYSSVAAILILTISAEILIIMESFPIKSICLYAQMFKTVSINFLKLFTLFSIVIFSFAFAFYKLFRPKVKPLQTGKYGVVEEEDFLNGFHNPLISIFKTIIMITGEYDAGSIDFDNNDTKFVVFILFVFFVSIILLNLLNGLAVSDTTQIRSEAQMNIMIQKVGLISTYMVKVSNFLRAHRCLSFLLNFAKKMHNINRIEIDLCEEKVTIFSPQFPEKKEEMSSKENHMCFVFDEIFQIREGADRADLEKEQNEKWKLDAVKMWEKLDLDLRNLTAKLKYNKMM